MFEKLVTERTSHRTVVFLSNDAIYLFNFRSPLMRLMKARGWEVVAVAPPAGGGPEKKFSDLGVRFVSWTLAPAGQNALGEILAVRRLISILVELRPNLLFSYTIKPVIYGMIAGAIIGVRRRVAMIPGLGYAFIDGKGFRRRLVGRVARLGYWIALRLAHQVIFMNKEDRDFFASLGLLSGRARVGITNGSGVDLSLHTFSPMPDVTPVFLLVSRLQGDKGVYEFVEAARIARRRLPDARFVLVGAPDASPTAVKQAEIDAWVADGLIEHRGYLPDPRDEYRRCTVFVLPSYREGAPRVNFEAMAAGRALITTDVPGCRRTVADGRNGILVPARDAQALADAMIELGSDPDRARAMGVEGRKLCEDLFDLEIVARDTVALIEGSSDTVAAG